MPSLLHRNISVLLGLIISTSLPAQLLLCSAYGDHPHAALAAANSSSPSPLVEPTSLRSEALILVKIYCLLIVFFATFLSGISPCFLKWNRGLLVLGTQFAGGVFLGTATMHFLSDSDETFKDRTAIDYPFAFMLACAGYLLTMFSDCVIQWVFVKESSNPYGSSSTPNLGIEIDSIKGSDQLPTHVDSNDQICKCGDDSTEINHGATNFVAATLVSKTSLSDAILLIVALCFHSVFEGIAIGIAQTSADAWRALWTISLHKVFAAIAMGIALLRLMPTRPLCQCAIYSFAFGISSPIGVAIGIVVDSTTQGAVADWIYAISMGLACGVFVYVAINHLLVKGYTSMQCRVGVDTPFYKFVATTLGVGIIAVVMIWD